MTEQFVNQRLLSRFDELIPEGEGRWQGFQKDEKRVIMDIVGFAQWSTSCLNLLDELSTSTNRFVTRQARHRVRLPPLPSVACPAILSTSCAQ